MKANEVCTQLSWTPRLQQTQIWEINVFMNLVPGAAPVEMVFVDCPASTVNPCLGDRRTRHSKSLAQWTDTVTLFPDSQSPCYHSNLQNPPEGSYS